MKSTFWMTAQETEDELKSRVILPPIHGNWTGADVREYLPDVLLVHNARVVNARVCGRLNQFATVFIHGYHYSWQFAWDTIAHSINTGKPLNAD